MMESAEFNGGSLHYNPMNEVVAQIATAIPYTYSQLVDLPQQIQSQNLPTNPRKQWTTEEADQVFNWMFKKLIRVI